MSFILAAPRRIYVVLLFWQRLTGRCATCPLGLTRAEQALGGRPAAAGEACRPLRCVMKLGLRRVLWSRLVGLTVFVLDPGSPREEST